MKHEFYAVVEKLTMKSKRKKQKAKVGAHTERAKSAKGRSAAALQSIEAETTAEVNNSTFNSILVVWSDLI